MHAMTERLIKEKSRSANLLTCFLTGIKGAPGKDCQLIYQPAASAEARAIAKLEQAQQVPAPDPAPSAPASVTAQRLTDLQSAEVLSEEAKV